jgi:hypothetical protein
MQNSRRQAKTAQVTVLLPVFVPAVSVPAVSVTVLPAVTVMIVVMAAGPGQYLAHASQHACYRALQHINTYHPQAAANDAQQHRPAPTQATGCAARNRRQAEAASTAVSRDGRKICGGRSRHWVVAWV